ncbi:family 43 glycosylhydrolase [Devosia rhodophyticola]|uniref:Family 43 glycosylhydrolase n=1 Tax=Devosia rhodophyticola TaxID=3026423 RepID=A0ABY7YUL6_9HYPH|nr:family 43 glycosylhydrolase [Devosia rhodophyticola]WDR04798.1 family 43 glycosylhydrolase [Devosia rhodophyticola]
MQEKSLSAASRRAGTYRSEGADWYCNFTYTQLVGLGPEVGIHRRDPSSILLVDGVHYVYYTRSSGPHFGRGQLGSATNKLFPWDYADVYYATSKDGIVWQEQGPAITRGSAGSFDARTVCTPDVLQHEGKFYLVYQTQSDRSSYDSARSENIGMAIADSPTGPWRKVDKQILAPMDDGVWFGGEGTYNSGNFAGVTHDPSLYFYKGEFWLYYKCGSGASFDEGPKRHKHSGPDTRWGVATSANPDGPYQHSPLNPITNSGHETMLWHYNDGIAALLNRDGPEQDTIQWAPDGINFEVMAHVSATPQAGGAFRSGKEEAHPLAGMQWGLCHLDERGAHWNYLMRFDADQRQGYRVGFSYPPSSAGGIF